MIQILVVAPTLALRAGLRAILMSDEQIEVTAEAAVLDDLDILPPQTDVIVMEGRALARSDLAALLEDANPPPAILILSDHAEDARPLKDLPARAWGILPLDCSEEEMLAAVHSLHHGLVTAPPNLLQPLLSQQSKTQNTEQIVDELTPRELEVLELLAEGLANKQIALEMDISEHTVKFHVSSIYLKLGVTNRTEAVTMGARLGWIML